MSSIVDELVGRIHLRMSCEGTEKVRILSAARTGFGKQRVEDIATAAFGAKRGLRAGHSCRQRPLPRERHVLVGSSQDGRQS